MTEPGFTRKMKDLIRNDGLSAKNVKLLKLGRHFRMSRKTKLILGRDENENNVLERLANNDEIKIMPTDFAGTTGLITGPGEEKYIEKAGGILIKFSKIRDKNSDDIEYYNSDDGNRKTLCVKAAGEAYIKATSI